MAGTEVITLEQVEDVLLHGGEELVLSPDAIQEDMVQRILGADKLDQAFARFEATPARDIEGILIDVTGIAWMQSAFEEGPKVYALLQAKVCESGEELTVSMGGRTLMASFLWAQRNEAMPIKGTFRKEQSATNRERSFWTFTLAPRKA